MKTDFRTIINPVNHPVVLDHKSPTLLIGSCFSENMGQKFKSLKFDSISNPLGISYNPISIHEVLQLNQKVNPESNNGIFFSYQLHSGLNQLNKTAYQTKVQQQLEIQRTQLSKNGTLIITYGTAWVHELKDAKQIVNNCHKMPGSKFSKRLLSVDEIIDSWTTTSEYLTQHFSQKQILFTISPIRHLKDGARENQLSKSTLHLAVDRICSEFKNCAYFPSYEIMLDDLRDYRFYKEDMTHPNNLAINYIWEKFSNLIFSEDTRKLNKEIEKVNTALLHKPFHSKSEQHQQFLIHLLERIVTLQERSALDFQAEITNLQTQIG